MEIADTRELIRCLPPLKRGGDGQIDWACWTGALIDAMQDTGAYTDDIFEAFLWEAAVIAEHFSDCLDRDRMLKAITEFSAACAGVIAAPKPPTRLNCH